LREFRPDCERGNAGEVQESAEGDSVAIACGRQRSINDCQAVFNINVNQLFGFSDPKKFVLSGSRNY
jgi:hypothetical protein